MRFVRHPLTWAALFAVLVALSGCEKETTGSNDDKPGAAAATNAATETATQADPEPAPEAADAAPTEAAPPAGDADAEADASSDEPYVVRTIPQTDLAMDKSCQGEKTPACETPPAWPACGPAAANDPTTVGELLAADETRVGEQVTVVGVLEVDTDTISCTQLACGGQCCNTCQTGLRLRATDDQPEAHIDFMAGPGAETTHLACVGDESVVCCTAPPEGGEVQVTATVMAAGTNQADAITLSRPTICTR